MKTNLERLQRAVSNLQKGRNVIPSCTDNINQYWEHQLLQNELTQALLLAILEELNEH